MICSDYQTGNFSIAVFSNNQHQLVKQIQSEMYVQSNTSNSTLIEKTIQIPVIEDQPYLVVVTINSIGVSVSNSTNFSKLK